MTVIKNRQHQVMCPPRGFSQSIGWQKGISLIEALVVMLIFSTGLLGLAAMQSVSLSRTDELKQSTIASFKAQEFIDRMHATIDWENPGDSSDIDGLIDQYAAVISPGDPTFAGTGIGVDNAADVFNCPAAPTVNCTGLNAAGTAPTVCTTAQIIEYDIWEVFCDPNTGLGVSNPDTGTIGIQDMQIAIVRIPPDPAVAGPAAAAGIFERELYIEWVAGSADQNVEFTGQRVTTNLCGTNRQVDAHLDVYCVKF